MFKKIKLKTNYFLFTLKIKFDRNKQAHLRDIKSTFAYFLFYLNEGWRNVNSKEEIYQVLYEKFSKILEKNLRFEEDINLKKYLFYYLLAKEELKNPIYYHYKNDKEFKLIYEDFIKLLMDASINGGYFEYYEFLFIIENLKKRYKKELREINSSVYDNTYKPRKVFYNQIKNFFTQKLKEMK